MRLGFFISVPQDQASIELRLVQHERQPKTKINWLPNHVFKNDDSFNNHGELSNLSLFWAFHICPRPKIFLRSSPEREVIQSISLSYEPWIHAYLPYSTLKRLSSWHINLCKLSMPAGLCPH